MGRELLTGSSPDQIFEQARIYLKEDKLDESLELLSALVDLQPQNAEYLAWQARVLFTKEDSRAFETAEAALDLDENQSLAYAVRGAVRAGQEHHTEAIRDLTTAIDIDPNNDWALRRRAESFTKIGDYQKAIIDRAHSYTIYLPQFYPEDDPLYLAEQHFVESLLPVLEGGHEHLVEFWPSVLFWGLEEQEKLFGGYSFTHLYGTGGTGYLCLTDKNIRIVSLGKLTQQMPPLEKGKKGLLAELLLPTTHKDEREVETTDRTWTVPHSSIIEAKLTKPTGFSDKDVKFVKLATDVETWEIFTADENILLTALNMAAVGELTKIWDEEKQVRHSEDKILALIEKLAELRRKGAISDENFEVKKKELLSRL